MRNLSCKATGVTATSNQVPRHNHQGKTANIYRAEQKGASPEQNVQRDHPGS